MVAHLDSGEVGPQRGDARGERMTDTYWLGVDLGGTKILAGLYDGQLELQKRVKLATLAEQGPDLVMGRVRQAIEQVIAEAGVDVSAIGGLGLGVPGQVLPTAFRVRFAPNLDWRDLDLRPHLQLPFPVWLENDVRLGTYGELARGAAQGAQHVLGIFVGTGIGGALILDGKLYHGFRGHAGEIGHMVIHWRKGHTLEEVAGRRSLTRRIPHLLEDAPKHSRKNWKHLDPTSLKSSHLAELYHKDDPIMAQLIDEAARAVGSTLGSMLNLLSPEVIVLGGGLATALGNSFRERVWEFAVKFSLPGASEGVRLVPAALGDDAGIVGAAAYAWAMSGTAGDLPL